MNPLEFNFSSSHHHLKVLQTKLADQEKFVQFIQAPDQFPVMVPLGPLAFVPAKIVDNSSALLYVGCKTFIKMPVEEAKLRSDKQIEDLQKQIEELTRHLERTKVEIQQIQQEGTVIRNCGFGLFEIQESEGTQKSKAFTVVSEQERAKAADRLNQKSELSEEQRKDLKQLDRLVELLGIEEPEEVQSGKHLQQKTTGNELAGENTLSKTTLKLKKREVECKERKVSFKDTVQTQFFYSDSCQLDGVLEDEELKSTESTLVRNSIPLDFDNEAKVCVSARRNRKKHGSDSFDSSKISNSSNSFNAVNTPDSPNTANTSEASVEKSNSKQTEKNVMANRIVERPQQPRNASIEQIEREIHMKEIKQAYHKQKEARITRERNRELYSDESSTENPSIFKSRRQFSNKKIAFSKAELKVLQLDRDSFYGAQEATLSSVDLKAGSAIQQELARQFFAEPTKQSSTGESSIEFNLDLAPKLLFSNCQMTQQLIETGIAEYLEFKPITAIYHSSNEEAFIKVPLSKEELFTSKDFTLVEKRLMMRVIESLQQQQPIEECLCKMPTKIKQIIRTCLHLREPRQEEEFAKKFVASCGAFSHTPYLYCVHGSSELLQGFIRLSAVNGAIQILSSGQYVEGDLKREESHYAFCKEGQLIVKGKNLLSKRYSQQLLYRKFILSRGSLFPDLFGLGYLERGEEAVIKIFQSVSKSSTDSYCKIFIFDLVAFIYFESQSEFEEEFQNFAKNLNPISVYWWKSPRYCEYFLNEKSVVVIESSMDFDYYLEKAKEVFQNLYPNSQFLAQNE